MDRTHAWVKELNKKQLNWAAAVALRWIENDGDSLKFFLDNQMNIQQPQVRPVSYWACTPLELANRGISVNCLGATNWVARFSWGARVAFSVPGEYEASGVSMLDAGLRTLVLASDLSNRGHIYIPSALVEV